MKLQYRLVVPWAKRWWWEIFEKILHRVVCAQISNKFNPHYWIRSDNFFHMNKFQCTRLSLFLFSLYLLILMPMNPFSTWLCKCLDVCFFVRWNEFRKNTKSSNFWTVERLCIVFVVVQLHLANTDEYGDAVAFSLFTWATSWILFFSLTDFLSLPQWHTFTCMNKFKAIALFSALLSNYVFIVKVKLCHVSLCPFCHQWIYLTEKRKIYYVKSVTVHFYYHWMSCVFGCRLHVGIHDMVYPISR